MVEFMRTVFIVTVIYNGFIMKITGTANHLNHGNSENKP